MAKVQVSLRWRCATCGARMLVNAIVDAPRGIPVDESKHRPSRCRCGAATWACLGAVGVAPAKGGGRADR